MLHFDFFEANDDGANGRKIGTYGLDKMPHLYDTLTIKGDRLHVVAISHSDMMGGNSTLIVESDH